MHAYKTFLKVIGMFLLIPLLIGMVVLAGFIGFGIDFSNSFGNSGGANSGSMYIIALPLMVLIALVWGMYTMAAKSRKRRRDSQTQTIRREVYREQQLGLTPEENIRNLLAIHGGMTADELMEQCRVDDETLMSLLRQLLQEGVIRQDITVSPPTFRLV
ncbi:hypothetical protein KC957_01290 [Candidatus Saccharibacteria bacterium]|nr:hypothetical protein [Candidatus Saccharibacteria bacterium]